MFGLATVENLGQRRPYSGVIVLISTITFVNF